MKHVTMARAAKGRRVTWKRVHLQLKLRTRLRYQLDKEVLLERLKLRYPGVRQQLRRVLLALLSGGEPLHHAVMRLKCGGNAVEELARQLKLMRLRRRGAGRTVVRAAPLGGGRADGVGLDRSAGIA
jgi:hypothetical protein